MAWVGRLIDVAPDGSARLITQGWLRASFRHVDPARSRPGAPYLPDDRDTPVTIGETIEYRMDIWDTAYTLRAGAPPAAVAELVGRADARAAAGRRPQPHLPRRDLPVAAADQHERGRRTRARERGELPGAAERRRCRGRRRPHAAAAVHGRACRGRCAASPRRSTAAARGFAGGGRRGRPRRPADASVVVRFRGTDRRGRRVTVTRRYALPVLAFLERRACQPENSAMTSSSIASEGRHSTRRREERTASMSSVPFRCASAKVARNSSCVITSARSTSVRDGLVHGIPSTSDVVRMETGDACEDDALGRGLRFGGPRRTLGWSRGWDGGRGRSSHDHPPVQHREQRPIRAKTAR